MSSSPILLIQMVCVIRDNKILHRLSHSLFCVIGPAESLFKNEFFQLLHTALTEQGVFSTQAECMWLYIDDIRKALEFNRTLFPQVRYAYSCVPSYPCGQIGHIVCSKNPNVNLTKPLRRWPPEKERELFRYYSAEMHESAFVLPVFAKKYLFPDD